MPTKQKNRGIGPPVPLEYTIGDGIDAVTFTSIGGGKSMTWKEPLSANYTDGILILHKGRVVYEKYFGCLDEIGKVCRHVDDQVHYGTPGRDPSS